MSDLKTLSIDRMKMETGGEVLTLTSVMAVLAIALVAVYAIEFSLLLKVLRRCQVGLNLIGVNNVFKRHFYL